MEGMAQVRLTKPILIVLYGFPGSGKTSFARQFCETINAAHINSERIRGELFEKPKYDKAESAVVDHLTEYMMEEFLKAGVSVVYDANIIRAGQRRKLREVARKTRSEYMLVWFQIDIESAFTRVVKRDRRKADNRFARAFDRTGFDAHLSTMQHPVKEEDYIVLSGKHAFGMQRNTIMKHFFDLNLITADDVASHLVKPGLINLVPAAGRVDLSRRNITIR